MSVRALLGRLWQALLVIALVATVTFVLIRLAPGDPFSIALDNPRLSPALRAQWRAAYGLDGSILTQYGHWLTALARGDLGWSTSTNQPVTRAIAQALPHTMVLMSIALVLAFLGGAALGAWQAARRHTAVERGLSWLTQLGTAVPDFWLALVVLLTGAYWFRLFPVGGVTDPLLPLQAGAWTVFVDRVRHLVLPTLTLVVLIASPLARVQRAALLDRLGADWVRTATAKGVPPGQVFRRHAWRTALLPMVTLGGLLLPALVGGAVFVEQVFAWPGMGRLAAGAVASRDYHLVVGCVLVGAVMVVTGSVLADLVASALDPRSDVGAADTTPQRA
jgi:peptide/nickel transport system permease protein